MAFGPHGMAIRIYEMAVWPGNWNACIPSIWSFKCLAFLWHAPWGCFSLSMRQTHHCGFSNWQKPFKYPVCSLDHSNGPRHPRGTFSVCVTVWVFGDFFLAYLSSDVRALLHVVQQFRSCAIPTFVQPAKTTCLAVDQEGIQFLQAQTKGFPFLLALLPKHGCNFTPSFSPDLRIWGGIHANLAARDT